MDKTVFDKNSFCEGPVVVIPDGCVTIEAEAFSHKGVIEKIVIPDSVKRIEERAFSGCGVKEIVMGKGVEVIGAFAFEYCANLTGIDLPDSLKLIYRGAFYGCKNLKSIKIPLGVKEISNSLCYGCENLEEVLLHDNITTISAYAFFTCSIKKIVIPGSVKVIQNSAFAWNYFSEIIFEEGLNIIGAGAFSSCAYLKKVVFPKSLVRIEETAFCYCVDLSNISFNEGLEYIGDNAFYCCRALEISIPSSVGFLGSDSFISPFIEKVNLKRVVNNMLFAFSSTDFSDDYVLDLDKFTYELNIGDQKYFIPYALFIKLAKKYSCKLKENEFDEGNLLRDFIRLSNKLGKTEQMLPILFEYNFEIFKKKRKKILPKIAVDGAKYLIQSKDVSRFNDILEDVDPKTLKNIADLVFGDNGDVCGVEFKSIVLEKMKEIRKNSFCV